MKLPHLGGGRGWRSGEGSNREEINREEIIREGSNREGRRHRGVEERHRRHAGPGIILLIICSEWIDEAGSIFLPKKRSQASL